MEGATDTIIIDDDDTMPAVNADGTADHEIGGVVVRERSGSLPAGGTMLEHLIFVRWCVSCGQEAPDEAQWCSRCSGRVQRHQRVLELPDPPPHGSGGLLSLRTLRAALADVSMEEDVSDSAILLFEQGPDPGVALLYPEFAAQLAALAMPPTFQRTLVNRGFVSLEQVTTAITSAPDVSTFALHLGLSPAAEVLLRRLCSVAADLHPAQLAQQQHPGKRPQTRVVGSEPLTLSFESPEDGDPELTIEMEPAKRMRIPGDHHVSEGTGDELALQSSPHRWDSQMQAIEDGGQQR